MSRNVELLDRAANGELLTPSGIPAILQPSSSWAPLKGLAKEETTKLVQSLFYRGGHAGGPKIVSFSGIARGDRSSWICARAAEYLAAQGAASVCLVDADFESPQLHQHYGISNRSGLAECLTANDPIRASATRVSRNNLWLLTSGVGAGINYNVESVRARFLELREEFDHVLISAPPLARQTESTLMGQLADGIVLIVEANKTRRDSLRQIQDELETAQVSLLGAVLDQRTYPIPKFLYRWL
jgi:succinoglycan biosynthesis transport protein ExoP